MKTTVNERITQIISQFGYKSKRSFAEKIGIAQTYQDRNQILHTYTYSSNGNIKKIRL